MKSMSKHLDYVKQPDGSFKWQLAEIPAVKSTPVETPKPKKEQRRFTKKKPTPLSE